MEQAALAGIAVEADGWDCFIDFVEVGRSCWPKDEGCVTIFDGVSTIMLEVIDKMLVEVAILIAPDDL